MAPAIKSVLCFFAVSEVVLADLGQHSSLLERVEARLQRALGHVASTQPHALDDEMCACRSGEAAGEQARPVLVDDWVSKHCDGWGARSRCMGEFHQEIKRIAPYQPVLRLVDDGFSMDAVRSLKHMAASYIEEQRGLLSGMRRVREHLSAKAASVSGVTEAEVADRLDVAAKMEISPDRSITLRLGVRTSQGSLDASRSCECFHVRQPRVMWDDAPDAEASGGLSLRGDSSVVSPASLVLPDRTWRSTLEQLAREEGALVPVEATSWRKLKETAQEKKEASIRQNEAKLEEDELFQEALGKAGQKYAKHHTHLTRFFLWCWPFGGLFMEPVSNSGPPMPRFTSRSSLGCNYAPVSNAYNEGFCFPWALGCVGYCRSCPYGPLFSSCPGCLGYLPINPSGRQWPERTCLGSHICASSSDRDGNDDDAFFEIYEKMKKSNSRHSTSRRLEGGELNEALYGAEGQHYISRSMQRLFAPAGQVYDARLVESLYEFSAQGAGVSRVTLFTSRLTQLRIAGLNPERSDWQHFGVTLELSKPVMFGEGSWRFITLEMMASGLMWTLSEAFPESKEYVYVKKTTMTYDDLSLKVVARYLAEQQGRTYAVGSTDCQTLASELAMRLSLHGRRLDVAQPELLHGPSHAEYKSLHNHTFDPHFPASCAVAVLLVLGLLKLAHMAYLRFGMPSARSPMGASLIVLGSLSTGTMLAPLLAGAWWYRCNKTVAETEQPVASSPSESEEPLANENQE